MMGIGIGEVVGGYGASVDLTEPLSNWRSGIARRLAEAMAMLTVMLVAIYALLRLTALRPLERLSDMTQRLAKGNTNVPIEFDGRLDAIGAMARALGIFRDSLIAKQVLEAENEEAHRELQYLASHDPLTGLPNRALLVERLELALAAARDGAASVAVMCIDVDHFKVVNDTLSHGAGDRLLRIVAQRLIQAIGQTGFAARLGGDEFALVLTEFSGKEGIESLCRKLVAASGERVDLDGHKLPMTLSVGVAVSPADGGGAEDLLRHADAALYRSKEEGRNTYRFFDAGMNVALIERRELERELHDAFDRHELELHYQPLVDIASHRLVGVEALMRWNHRERGWVGPGTFIPIAESCGLIVPMGKWLLRTACEQAAMWPGITLAVNVSPAQFADDDFVDFIGRTLEETGLPADRLEIEITEGLLLDARHKSLEKLFAVHKMGVRIAMDDFGTGYSSLSSLQSFPFDKIKIDRSFVGQLEQDANAAVIVRSVVGLGRSLGMVITAEGVETGGQLEFLRREGCTQAQGYLLAKPQDALRLTALLGTWQPVPKPGVGPASVFASGTLLAVS